MVIRIGSLSLACCDLTLSQIFKDMEFVVLRKHVYYCKFGNVRENLIFANLLPGEINF